MNAPHHSEPAREAVASFRKKPVVIEAVRWDGDQRTFDAIERWVGKSVADTDGYTLLIPTLEGTMTASLNDWIIRGVKGEVYPCKPDIFAATYEPAASPAPAAGGLEAVREAAIELLSHLKLYVEEKLEPDDANMLHDRMHDLTAALASPAATSAETQGRDGVREAAELLSHLKLYVLEKLDQHDADALHDRMNDLTAALAPPTSAATRGEPVALTADDRRLLDKALEASTEHLYGFGNPAPAVESAQVKEALRPFVDALDGADDDKAGDGAHIWEAPVAMNITYGDLRRAAKAFASLDLATDAEG